MPRQVRIQFPGATYHVMCRGDRREDIFREHGDREMMLATLAETVEKTGWKVHAWVLMGNHYHLLVQTPEPNLVKGMTWFQTTYTLRFNAKHRLRGHVFAGRYKAVLVEGEDPAYFTTLLDYLHLNPVRAGLVRRERGEVLEAYRWSSWPGYLQPKLRQKWWESSRAFAAWQLEDSVAGRAALRRRVERRMATESAAECGLSEIAGQSLQSALRRGWYFGKESFRQWLLEKAGAQLGEHRRKRQNYIGPEIKAHDMAEAQRLLRDGLAEQNLRQRDLAKLKKGDSRKVAIAERIRRTTAVPLAWIAERLSMGTPSNVSQACRRYLNP